MRRNLAFGLVLALIGFAGRAPAAGLSIANIGNASAAAGSLTLPITTAAACPAGSAIILFSGIIANFNTNSAADSASNVYVFGAGSNLTLSGGVARQALAFVSAGTNRGLPNGSTITVTYASTTGIKLAAAACISGAIVVGSVQEATATSTTGTGTAPSIVLTTPTLSPAEIDVCGYVVVSGAGDTFTNTAGFTPLTQVSNSSTLNWAYKIVSDMNAVTCAPTLGTSRVWGASGRGYVQTQGVRALAGVGQ